MPIFLMFCRKHRLWVLVRTAPETIYVLRKVIKISIFPGEIFNFYMSKKSAYCMGKFSHRRLKKKKVQEGKDQEKAQSERDSHPKNRGGKKPNQQSGTYTMKHIVSRMSSYFRNRWPLSYLNLIKNMKTYIRRQQHKKN